MAKTKQMLKQKQKKKKWYPIYGPKLFGNELIGESHVADPENLKGKYIHANLSTILNNMKRQNTTITLRVKEVKDGKGFTEIIGLELVQTYVKRLVRRNRSKIDDSFVVKTKEGTLVRVKPLIITNSNCVKSVQKQIRAETKKFITERFSNQFFINCIDDVLSFRLQKSLKELLNKIFPIRSVEIRVITRELIMGKRSETNIEDLSAINKNNSNDDKEDNNKEDNNKEDNADEKESSNEDSKNDEAESADDSKDNSEDSKAEKSEDEKVDDEKALSDDSEEKN